ncbi:MAG: grasp-with-spasm system SPASM domain peptide maturase [Flavobacterium sp.]
MNKKYFKFYESCIPVVGMNRGIIYDLRRGNLYFLPKMVLQQFDKYSKHETEKFYSDHEDQKEVLDKYFNYLIENELIFFLEDRKRFPKINNKLSIPFILDVLFLEIDNFDVCKKNLFENDEINKLGCSEIVLISHQSSIDNLEQILTFLEYSKIHNITVIMSYDFGISDKLIELVKNNNRIREVIIFDVDEKIIINDDSNLKFHKKSLNEILTKRITDMSDFVPNLNSYLESLHKNLYFNRKIYIDNNGNIKHSFEDKTFYGNLKKNNLKNIIELDEFRKLWNVSKDQIEVCKDCEFRYICPDNRIPLEKIKGKYFHDTKCNYNPYNNKWE